MLSNEHLVLCSNVCNYLSHKIAIICPLHHLNRQACIKNKAINKNYFRILKVFMIVLLHVFSYLSCVSSTQYSHSHEVAKYCSVKPSWRKEIWDVMYLNGRRLSLVSLIACFIISRGWILSNAFSVSVAIMIFLL